MKGVNHEKRHQHHTRSSRGMTKKSLPLINVISLQAVIDYPMASWYLVFPGISEQFPCLVHNLIMAELITDRSRLSFFHL
jgi:hypothetical protein